MIYELRTYTVKPGTVGDMVKAASTVSRDIRGDNYGKLEGYWLTEIGPLNQVMHMWSYSDFNEHTRLRGSSPGTSAGPASTFRCSSPAGTSGGSPAQRGEAPVAPKQPVTSTNSATIAQNHSAA